MSVRLDPDDHAWLERAAADRGIDVAETLRRLVHVSRVQAEAAGPSFQLANPAKPPRQRQAERVVKTKAKAAQLKTATSLSGRPRGPVPKS